MIYLLAIWNDKQLLLNWANVVIITAIAVRLFFVSTNLIEIHGLVPY